MSARIYGESKSKVRRPQPIGLPNAEDATGSEVVIANPPAAHAAGYKIRARASALTYIVE